MSKSEKYVAVLISQRTADELTKYVDCYAPLLNEVALACTQPFKESAEVDEIKRLRGIIDELIPYLIIDVRSGITLGEPPLGHDDDCSDCDWYRESLAWKQRLKSGELGSVYRL
jgi:hypothetical protein